MLVPAQARQEIGLRRSLLRPCIVCWLFLVFFAGRGLFSQSVPDAKLAAAAEEARLAGENSRAIDLYSKALQQAPSWTEGWWRYGGLLYEDRQFKSAESAFARLTELAPDNPLGYALLGLCEYEQSDWNNAALHLNKALNYGHMPAEIANSVMYHFGLVLMRQKNRNGALIIFQLLFHQAPEYPNLTLALGAAELGMEELPPPGSSLFQAATLAGQSAVAVIDLKPDEAEKLYRQLVAQFPDQPFAHLALGLFLENVHRDDEAEKEFLAETKVSPDSEVPWIWLGRVALAQKDTTAARSYAAQARKLNPNDPLCDLIEGRSYVVDHEWKKALPPLQKAEAGAPDSYEVHFALASVYAALHLDQAAASERKLFLQTNASADDSRKGANP
jgi:tetratricopeptide (TPR) repeat protein